MPSLSERFWSKVEKGPACWIWTRTLNSAGRPVISVGGRAGSMRLASHVSWFLEYGAWPSMQLNHHCDNALCVRPDHLYDGTQVENMQDMAERGKCPAGHPRTAKHLQVRKDGTRYCKTCQNNKRRQARKEAK